MFKSIAKSLRPVHSKESTRRFLKRQGDAEIAHLKKVRKKPLPKNTNKRGRTVFK